MGFPSHMCLQTFEMQVLVPKDTPTRYAHIVGSPWDLTFQCPIELQPRDQVVIDIRTSSIEVVQRRGVTVWHAGWRN